MRKGRRLKKRAGWAVLLLFTLVGWAVIFPLTRRGWVILLDWVSGPRPSVPRTFWGLDGGSQAAMPFVLLVRGLQHLVGPAVGWLPLLVFFPLAAVGVARLQGGPLLARVAAALAYCVNPFVFDRIGAGQVAFLLGYGLLPYATRSLIEAAAEDRPRRMTPALWLSALTALAIHFAWIGAVLVVAAAIGQRLRRRAVVWLFVVVVLFAASSCYLLVGSRGSGTVAIGSQDLASFRTLADPRFGLYLNVAGLYGFWRLGPRLPKQVLTGWPLVLLAALVVIAIGVRRTFRDPARRPTAVILVVVGVAGYFLALGDQGPFGSLYRWAFLHLPGFAAMREPQKFLALLALAYAWFFGAGVEASMRRAAEARRALPVAAVLLALPLVYTPTLVGGLDGQLAAARYPAGWTDADRRAGQGSGRILFLPWHQYLSFPSTPGPVANPADAFFSREVLAGDDVELPTIFTESRVIRSHFLEFLFAHGPQLTTFGHLVAPLDVEYIALARSVDWRSYQWLDRQRDLERVLDRPSVVLYRNRAAVSTVRFTTSTRPVADWGELVAAVEAGAPAETLSVRAQAPGPIRMPPTVDTTPPRTGAVAVRRRSPAAYDVGPSPAGRLVFGEPFDSAWRLGERAPVPASGGTNGFAAGGGGSSLTNRHWRSVRLGYFGSAVVTVLVGCWELAERTRKRRRRAD